MSTYTVTTNFTLKDSLPSGDPAKIIRGADFGTEFSNISVAINDNAVDITTLTSTKLNSDNPTSTGTFTHSGAASLASLSVTNASTFNTINVTGDADLSSLDVTGTSDLTNLSVSGTSDLTTLSVSGTSTLANASVTGTATVGTLNVTGSTGNLDVNGTLDVSGDVTCTDDVYLGTKVRPFEMVSTSSDDWRLVTRGTGDEIHGLSSGNNGGLCAVGRGDTGIAFSALGSFNYILPYHFQNSQSRDDVIDIGSPSASFDNIYATNGTIQTSDSRRKSNIRELTEAEQRVAKACKGLLRAYQWNSAIDLKGEDEARIHFGIIAQDLKAAFEAEGLDAGRYGVFIEGKWTDEETGEEHTRLGVRYVELLAFIIASI